MLTEQAINEFMLSRGGLRPRTQKEYRKQLKMFQGSFLELPKTPQPIQAWFNSLQERRLSLSTIRSIFVTIRSLYRQTHEWHPKITDPTSLVRVPKPKNKPMRIFTTEELYNLFLKTNNPRDLALITLLMDVGPRAQECVNLNWTDVTTGFVTLKGKTGEREVPISGITYRRIEELRNGNNSGNVFLGERGPLTYNGLYKLIRRICRQAGIYGNRCSPHSFRHSFATYYAAAEGCEPKMLQSILGHSDFRTTLHYIQDNRARKAQNHHMCTPLRLIPGAAQGSLFSIDSPRQVLVEAEAIIEGRST